MEHISSGSEYRTVSNQSHKLWNIVWQYSVTPLGKVLDAKKFCKYILKENLHQNYSTASETIEDI
jgi:hypothetical protein